MGSSREHERQRGPTLRAGAGPVRAPGEAEEGPRAHPAHEGGRTEHAVLTRYHGRGCTQREHERVHEHKRTWLYPSDPNDASLRFCPRVVGRWWICGRKNVPVPTHLSWSCICCTRRDEALCTSTCLLRYSQTSMDCSKELQNCKNGSKITLKASQAAGGTRIRDEAPVYTLC